MNIGFIGLGTMGAPMCMNLLKKHSGKLYLFDLIETRAKELEPAGAIVCGSAMEVANNSDVIISMVPKSEHSFSLYQSILPCLNSSKSCIDMSTIDPSVSIQISNLVKNTGADFFDAPVVKSKPAAIAGKLGIYVGGNADGFKKIEPILRCMGENIKYLGKNGNGLVMKICHNALVAQIQNGVNETLSLAISCGLSASDFAEAISYGGGQNFYLDSKIASLQKGDYSVNFSIENMAKDLNICKKLALENNISIPGVSVAESVYAKAINAGMQNEDFCATFRIVSGKAHA